MPQSKERSLETNRHSIFGILKALGITGIAIVSLTACVPPAHTEDVPKDPETSESAETSKADPLSPNELYKLREQSVEAYLGAFQIPESIRGEEYAKIFKEKFSAVLNSAASSEAYKDRVEGDHPSDTKSYSETIFDDGVKPAAEQLLGDKLVRAKGSPIVDVCIRSQAFEQIIYVASDANKEDLGELNTRFEVYKVEVSADGTTVAMHGAIKDDITKEKSETIATYGVTLEEKVTGVTITTSGLHDTDKGTVPERTTFEYEEQAA